MCLKAFCAASARSAEDEGVIEVPERSGDWEIRRTPGKKVLFLLVQEYHSAPSSRVRVRVGVALMGNRVLPFDTCRGVVSGIFFLCPNCSGLNPTLLN